MLPIRVMFTSFRDAEVGLLFSLALKLEVLLLNNLNDLKQSLDMKARFGFWTEQTTSIGRLKHWNHVQNIQDLRLLKIKTLKVVLSVLKIIPRLQPSNLWTKLRKLKFGCSYLLLRPFFQNGVKILEIRPK